jgi:hypothetical protein
MNCLESRRLLLAAPRSRNTEHNAHIAACAECARLVSDLADLDRRIEKAAYIPAAEALSHRVLMRGRPRPPWQYAAAAAFAIACVALGLMGADLVYAPGYARTAEAVGPTHPGVAAIEQVADEDVERSYSATVSDGPAEIEQGLKRLGLVLRKGEATAHYVGKCHVSGSSQCDRIVLSTAYGHANVLLMPDYPMPDRMLVSDRRMIALVNPAARGGYIVVADTARTARRMERLLTSG